ncbi:hypothetical protein KZO01_23050 [Kurthia zopfii]|uniref:Uncharacterized protein YpmB n=1 Tax=Kurthia zopfii TaxID=1650 RepID=A0A2U3ABK9_9BACL|nr:DUF5590 domain-containing protein [Kurthia zopfii]PWI21841.1 hypothetical protein DF281_10070 [Kurthia zopfii]TDR36565.1 uncharacterized protein YpmB [Kurthia zopfii]STX09348.1 Uncharacterized protein conserved in bacteria [Kurthia zopfii]VEI06300.1 Uncharacterized protein conserved in bacteria [Kurthia zopfii]GEK31996.1 hypothetical protein KZO01_23050 [Kurthia zopfii]
MKNWIKFLSIFFVILAVVLTGLITIKANAPFSKATNDSEKIVLNDKLLTTIDDSYVYNSKKTYVTVIGDNKDQKKEAVFVDQNDKKAKKETVLLSSGISKSKAIKAATRDQKVKKVLHAKIGLEEAGPVWEVSFKDQNDQLNYVYVLFENGQWWKKITNL